MPGHPDQEQSRGHAHEEGRGPATENHVHEEGRGPAVEDRGFLMEMLGIFALDSLGEIPGLNSVKRAYGKIKERFEVSEQSYTSISTTDLEFKAREGLEGYRSGFVFASDGLGNRDRRN